MAVGSTGTVSATATSGLAVAFSSLTPNICSISGKTVMGIAAVTCTIAANQAGNTTYNAATQVVTAVITTPNCTLTACSNTGLGITHVDRDVQQQPRELCLESGEYHSCSGTASIVSAANIINFAR